MADMPSAQNVRSRPARPGVRRSWNGGNGQQGGLSRDGGGNEGVYSPGANNGENPATGDNTPSAAANGWRRGTKQEEGTARSDSNDGRRHQPNGNGNLYVNAEPRADISDDGEEEEGIDFYEILDISRNATPSQIRAAYHTLSRVLHPDKQPPELRQRAAKHFNLILLAYETLQNPHKRITYDTLGLEGLKQKQLEVGVKALSPEEFKVWLQEQVHKQKVAQVMSLVNSKGDLVVAVDLCSWRFAEAREIVDPDGKRRVEVKRMPSAGISKYFARHSFSVPLEGLGRILVAPIPSFKELIGFEKPQERPKKEVQHVPVLTFRSSVAGTPYVSRATGTARPGVMIASSALSVHVGHAFPPAIPSSPPSISTYLSGLEMETASTFYPTRVVTSTVSKSFGASRLVAKTTCNSSPLVKPPVVEVTHARGVSQRGSVFMTFNTGSVTWPSAVSRIFSRPGPTSYFTIGYSSSPLVPSEDNDESDASSAGGLPSSVSRSKRSESWSITGSAGLTLGGGQIGFHYGRTFFIGTPIGGESPVMGPTGVPAKVGNTGIRLSVEGSIGLVGLMSWDVKAMRKIFKYTNIGLGVGLGPATAGRTGVVFKIYWSRLGQNITLPLILAPLPELESLAYATVAPIVGYTLLEAFILRPRAHRARRLQIEKYKSGLRSRTERRKRRADECIEMLRETADRRQKAQQADDGLVISSAGYGVRGKDGEWADVTVGLAMLVSKDRQVVIPKRVNKNHIRCFYDPAPGEEKQLWVEYQFEGATHEAVVGEFDALTIPLRQHCVE